MGIGPIGIALGGIGIGPMGIAATVAEGGMGIGPMGIALGGIGIGPMGIAATVAEGGIGIGPIGMAKTVQADTRITAKKPTFKIFNVRVLIWTLFLAVDTPP